jgi:hypothetical protein
MKKILLTIGLVAATTAAFAQGYISFIPGTYVVSTNGTVLSTLYTASAPKNNLGAGTVGLTTPTSTGNYYYYALLMTTFTGTTPTDLNVVDGTWKFSGLAETNAPGHYGQIANGPASLNVGLLSGWNATLNGGGPFTTSGTNYIMLVGWSANLGTTWAQVSNNIASVELNNAGYFSTISYFGESDIGYENPGTASAAGIVTIGSAANGGGFPITAPGNLIMVQYELPVPEPATFALVGLGGLSLLLFRRRN